MGLGQRNINSILYARFDEHDQVIEYFSIDAEARIERVYDGDGSFAHAYALDKTGERIAELVTEVKWKCPSCGAILFDVREWTAVPYCDNCGCDVDWENCVIVESYEIDRDGKSSLDKCSIQ